MIRLKLKAIKFNTDFRKSELTNLNNLLADHKEEMYDGNLTKDEVILFVSKSGNQLIWILKTRYCRFS
jgi:hypothetical protein